MTANENGGRLASTGLERSGRYSAFEAMNPRKFFAELKRRHVYRVAIAYGVVAWLLIQVATQVFPFFEIPSGSLDSSCSSSSSAFRLLSSLPGPSK